MVTGILYQWSEGGENVLFPQIKGWNTPRYTLYWNEFSDMWLRFDVLWVALVKTKDILLYYLMGLLDVKRFVWSLRVLKLAYLHFYIKRDKYTGAIILKCGTKLMTSEDGHPLALCSVSGVSWYPSISTLIMSGLSPPSITYHQID